MKLQAIHILVILLISLLGCSLFTCKMLEGLKTMDNPEKKKDIPLHPQTLERLPYTPLMSYTPLPKASPPPLELELSNADSNYQAFSDAGLETPFDINASTSLTTPSNHKIAPISSALPKGIPKSQIPEGDEDLYIRKSEVVPPVCPVCPDITESARTKPCPPCPPCARCPEPSFECKKVPNYSSSSANNGRSFGGNSIDGGMNPDFDGYNNSSFLPKPVLTDFSQFGM